MKYTDLQGGKLYHCKTKGVENISFIKKIDINGNAQLSHCLALAHKSFSIYTGDAYICKDYDWEFREATWEEEQWFNQCKASGKYEPKCEFYEIY